MQSPHTHIHMYYTDRVTIMVSKSFTTSCCTHVCEKDEIPVSWRVRSTQYLTTLCSVIVFAHPTSIDVLHRYIHMLATYSYNISDTMQYYQHYLSVAQSDLLLSLLFVQSV
jgi:hypothetical protein